MELLKTKILIISNPKENSVASKTMTKICEEITKLGSEPIVVDNFQDGYTDLQDTLDISAVLLDWDNEYEKCKTEKYAHLLLPKENTIFDYNVILYKGHALSSTHFKRPLLELESKGFNLTAPKDYPKEKIDYIREIKEYPKLIEYITKEDLKLIISPMNIIRNLRQLNQHILIFLYTKKLLIERLPISILEKINAYFWKNEETPTFVAKRIVSASKDYLEYILPPFFKALMTYVKKGKYTWHTPGHMGGSAFLRSPPGKIYFDFYGENVFSADLSISVTELGSLLSHCGPIAEAEKYAAKVFGAEYTYFVTNGTSTANKIVLGGTCVEKDIVILDRNSHLSSMQGIMISNLRPIYLNPVRNQYGLIGPIPMNLFSLAHLKSIAKNYPYLDEKELENNIKLQILTQCTYDGITYCIEKIASLGQKMGVKNLLFDEAWFPYAHFNNFYKDFHSMNRNFDYEGYDLPKSKPETEFKGNIFATQSTHKTLAAFSQASMIHVRNVNDPFFFDKFNNSFQANSSTSPQYALISSLDISSAIMDISGQKIMDDVLEEVIYFRCSISRIKVYYEKVKGGWFFSCWQPKDILERPEEEIYDPKYWILGKSTEESWHGFPNIAENEYLLDPLKVTIITSCEDIEIPACVVARYLSISGIIMEKVGYYTMLCLFTLGSKRGKSASLITALTKFKDLYDKNVELGDIFKKDTKFSNLGLRDFCNLINPEIKKMEQLENNTYNGVLPEIACRPFEANCALVSNKIDWVEVEKIEGRISAVLIVNYPPGIPTIMPGEKFNKNTSELINALANFGNKYPGYAFEVHGLIEKEGKFYIPCLKE